MKLGERRPVCPSPNCDRARLTTGCHLTRDIKQLIMTMMCNDLMCTQKLARDQPSLAHGTRVKTDMSEKQKKQLQTVESVRYTVALRIFTHPENIMLNFSATSVLK